jgi:tetratricopeptide (TPR) repeat protein
MPKPTLFVFLGAVLVLSNCGGAEKVERAYEAATKAAEKAATSQEKVAVWQAFLARYPNSERTVEVARTVVEYLAEELDRPEEADRFLVALLPRISNSERRRDVAFQRLPLLARLQRGEELRQLADELSLGRALTFAEAVTIAEAARRAGVWEVALQHYRQALPFATAKAYRAEQAGAPLSEDRLERAVRRRQAKVFTGLGWAEQNLGHTDRALRWFAQARSCDLLRFLGNTDSELGLLEGKTLLAAGKIDRALAVLAPEALFGDDPEALQVCRQAYVAKYGTEEGFEAFLARERERLARPAPDFTLPDYAGKEHTFSALSAGRVTLLAFWFPT